MGAMEEPDTSGKRQKTGFGPLRCPKPECGRVLFEMNKGFWKRAAGRILCLKCGEETVPGLLSFQEDDLSKLSIRFWCLACHEVLDRTLPAIRKYCQGCKAYHVMFLSLLLALPQTHTLSESC